MANDNKDGESDTNFGQIFFSTPGGFTTESKPFVAQTYQAGSHKLDTITKAAGCQSLPTNVIIQPNVIDKIEHKYNSSQRSEAKQSE